MGGSSGPISSIGKGLGAVATGGLSLIAPKSPFGAVGNDVGTALTGGANGGTFTNLNGQPFFGGTSNPNISGPFSLNPAQTTADQNAITNLGQQQYNQTLSQIPSSVGNAVNQELPGIEETLNSQHLLNSTALPQEIARQQEYLTQNLAIPAMQSLQGTQTAGLQRGLSMEDFINQANVAKTIGAQMAPQPPSSKAQAGTFMQGVGALAPLAKVAAK
jgi:hypothetical protein